MKKHLTQLSLLLFFFSADLSGIRASGIINSAHIIPAAPHSGDTIFLLIESSFSSGGCAMDHYSKLWNGPTLNVETYHCLGPLAYICDATDSIQIGPLDTGTYFVNASIYDEFEGFEPPCTIYQWSDTKSFTFHVDSLLTAIPDLHHPKAYNISIVANGNIIVRIREAGLLPLQFVLYDEIGKQLSSVVLRENETEIPLSGLATGIYLYKLSAKNGNLISGKLSTR